MGHTKKRRHERNPEGSCKKKEKRLKKKKRKISKHSSDPPLPGKEDPLDLSKELYPISSYLSDRAEMLNQMFMSLDWKHIRSMIPAAFKNLPIDKIKELTLRELLGMSKERIISVLNGEPLETSSDSDVDKEDLAVTADIDGIASSGISKNNVCSQERNELQSCNSSSVLKLQNQESNNSSDVDMLEIGITPKEMGELTEDKTGEDKKGKTLLEILELEMRARAIRALLNQEQEEVEMKPNPGPSTRERGIKTGNSHRKKKKPHDQKESLNQSENVLSVLLPTQQPTSSTDVDSANLPELCFQNCPVASNSSRISDNKDVVEPTSVAINERVDNLEGLSERNKMNDEKMENTGSHENSNSRAESSEALPSVSDNSWVARWCQSKDVQKVVTTSRMCAKIRNRMRVAMKSKVSSRTEELKPEINGSVNEYKTLAEVQSPDKK